MLVVTTSTGVLDIVGGRSGAYEQELRKAKNIALEEMKDEAARMPDPLAG